jgi:hypothetical protein
VCRSFSAKNVGQTTIVLREKASAYCPPAFMSASRLKKEGEADGGKKEVDRKAKEIL